MQLPIKGNPLSETCHQRTVNCKFLLKAPYIPLTGTNQVGGPYCEITAHVFPHRFMAQAWSAQAINRRGKNKGP